MAELDRACASMRTALRESNDERHQAFFAPVLDRMKAIIANERDGITLMLADDLANIRSAVRRLRLSDIDQDLDAPTPALAALRGARGNLVESIDNALDAAAALRLRPRHSEFGGIHVERRDVGEQLIRLDERLRAVQDAVGGLRGAAAAADAAPGTDLPSQTELVQVYVRTLTVEAASARFETATGKSAPPNIDISALTRAVAAMHEMAGDLGEAIKGLSGAMSEIVRAVGMMVVTTVERSWRGLKTVVSVVRRKLQAEVARPVLSSQPMNLAADGFALGNRFRDFDTAPEMTVVPAGEFMMGSPVGEGENDERPQHPIVIAKPFAVGIFPVTRGEFAAFVYATNYQVGGDAYLWKGDKSDFRAKASWRDPGFTQNDDHPVVCVNWYDAQAYVGWLQARSGGKHYRLLSEAEWEYCCRAGTKSAYSTGEAVTAEQANCGLDQKGTTLVNRFPPSSWGLRDMHGNVWEWCEDTWHVDYSGSPPTDGSAWKGGEMHFRVLRGGSWVDHPQSLRSAARNWSRSDLRGSFAGFRVARTL